jgi:hypothetical protein
MTKEDLKYFLQNIQLIKRNREFYTIRIKKLRDKIIKETSWLAGIDVNGSIKYRLPFQEQVIKYYEYKNMLIQRRSQYVIIFLTFALLIMTGIQVYLNFF